MFEAIKPLIDSGILNEETRVAIETAWTNKLNEAREEIRTEIRKEMAARYEHDKANMVEALDKMVNDVLTTEVQKIAEEKNQLTQDRVKFTEAMMDKLNGLDGFVNEALAAEMREFHADRKKLNDSLSKLENFVKENLQKEITEFAEDKADLARTKVAVITEGKAKLESLRNEFIKKSANLVEQTVTSTIRSELKQLKQDIQEAKENNFGRRLFEAFATEFSATHLNERVEIKKLMTALRNTEQQLIEARQNAENAVAQVAEKAKEIDQINESIVRKDKLTDLLKPLAKEKAAVMSQLLESVPTERLDDAFKKYLSPVMDGKATAKVTLVESKKEVTGDRAANPEEKSKSNNIVEIKRLAGLVKQ